MIRHAMTAAVLFGALAIGQAHAQAVVEDPGYCAQYYPNSNCTNYGPGNPLYPDNSYAPSGPAQAHRGSYAAMPDGTVARHHHRHRHSH